MFSNMSAAQKVFLTAVTFLVLFTVIITFFVAPSELPNENIRHLPETASINSEKNSLQRV
jgi:hypothetical protein